MKNILLDMEWFGNLLAERGFSFYSGVPCSLLKPLINYSISRQQYLAAVNEGDAIAHCAGAWIGGSKAVVMMQNSGLGNAVSPLTSLNFPFQIPVLGFVSLRGESRMSDEPQHELMGQITGELLSTMRIRWGFLSDDREKCLEQIREANACIEAGESYFFVVRKDTFAPFELDAKPLPTSVSQSAKITLGGELHKRIDVLAQLRDAIDQNTVLLATTGVTGRELYQLGHQPSQFYMVGSMGCISALALGLAQVRPDLKIIAIDGDGALLMRMGNLATLGSYAAPNLMHLLLDNGVHESTGNQQTVSSRIDFANIAAACGYTSVLTTDNPIELVRYCSAWRSQPSSTFIHLKIKHGHPHDLVRPAETPMVLLQQFMANLENLRHLS